MQLNGICFTWTREGSDPDVILADGEIVKFLCIGSVKRMVDEIARIALHETFGVGWKVFLKRTLRSLGNGAESVGKIFGWHDGRQRFDPSWTAVWRCCCRGVLFLPDQSPRLWAYDKLKKNQVIKHCKACLLGLLLTADYANILNILRGISLGFFP